MEKYTIEISECTSPWEVACKVIGATYYGKTPFGDFDNLRIFSVEDIRKIGKHLISYADVEGVKNDT